MTLRPAFPPGSAVLRRDRHHLQIGTSPGISFRDRPGLVAALRLVDGVRDIDLLESLARRIPELEGSFRETLTDLHRCGALLDARAWDAPGPAAHEAVALAVRRTPADLVRRRLARRSTFTVDVLGDAPCAPLARRVAAIACESGLTMQRHPTPRLTIVMTAGEADRSIFTALRDEGREHLPVAVAEGVVRWGPLVVPRESPCVTCHDLQRAEVDPSWNALVTQFGRAPASALACASLGATTLHAAAATIVAEVVNRADGAAVPAASRETSPVDGLSDAPTTYPIGFHDACGCRLLGGLS